jgi:hypothetical protein
MRPILKPNLLANAISDSRGHLLLAAIGPYCSFCERSLLAEFWLLDASTGVILEPESSVADWAQLLLVCYDCAETHRRAILQPTGDSLEDVLLPDRHETFKFADDAPFRYALEAVVVNDQSASGELRRRSPRRRVVVRGTTPEAVATVRHFGLNTRYWDGEATLNILDAEQSSGLDRRIDQRTEAWQMATEVIPIVRAALPPPVMGSAAVGLDNEPVVQMCRALATHQGFWSTFATVFWNEFHNAAFVLNLLVPPVNQVARGASLASFDERTESDGILFGPYPGTRLS